MREVIETLCDMIDHCRSRLDDLSPVALTPVTNLQLIQQAAEDADESELLWKTPELIAYANEAVREYALRTRCIRDSGRNTVGVTTFTVAPGTETVAMDPRLLFIRKVYWDDVVLGAVSERFADEEFTDWRIKEGPPTAVMMRRSERALRLYPIPTVQGVLTIDCDRTPITLMTEGVHTPEIQQAYLHDCIDWMCHLAYLKNDADTKDPKAALMYEQLFTMKVGPRPTALQLELEYHQSGRRRPRVYYY